MVSEKRGFRPRIAFLLFSTCALAALLALVAAPPAPTAPAEPASLPASVPATPAVILAPAGPAPAMPPPAEAAAPLLAQAAPPASSIPVESSGPTGPTGLPAAQPQPAARVAPSQNVTINLINRLVQKGVLSDEEAADLIEQAEADAAFAREQVAATQALAQETANAQMAASAALSAVTQAPPPFVPDPALAPQPGDVRIPYVPEIVKKQLREEIKEDVMEAAKEQKWAALNNLPEWVSRFRFLGDVRVRSERLMYPEGNDATGAFPNFNAINTGPPFDVTGNQFSPQVNVDQDRTRFRLRLRFGAEIDLGAGFTTGFRIATGETNSPVSVNQSLGLANNGQGGNFSKYAIWLDRAFIRYTLGDEPGKRLGITIGRFDNPFFSTRNLLWDEDLGFDGLVFQGNYEVASGVVPFLTAGAFPVFNTALNFSSIQPAKFQSNDKYLLAVQGGTDWQINEDLHFKVGAAYYYFDNIEGRLSDPYTPLTPEDASNTDESRPAFAQKGNTYRPIRNIVPDASNNFGTINQWQYFGLATPFRDLAVTARLDYTHFEPIQVSLIAEYVKNLAFNAGAINDVAVNNRGPNSPAGAIGSFVGGDTGWTVTLNLGHAALLKPWDWNVFFRYIYLESDAVVDGFTDSAFGNGGTNLEGYTVGGNLMLSPHVWLGLRWLSASSIAGPQYKNDIVQFDINASF